MNFSVLISVYKKDSSEALYKAISSVTLSQNIKPAQVVIVKDGQVDANIESVIQKCLSESDQIEFTVLSLKENKGLAAALNEGITKCKYEWIARMDADDISCGDRFEKQISYINEHSEISVLGGVIEEFYNTPGDYGKIRIVPHTHEDILKFMKRRNPINHMTVMYRKSAVLSVGGYSLECGKLEDYRLWVDLLIKGYKLANLDDVLLYVRVGNGFIERRSDKREIYDWDQLQKYMFDNVLINCVEKIRNMIFIRGFIMAPPAVKKLIYKILRRRGGLHCG